MPSAMPRSLSTNMRSGNATTDHLAPPQFAHVPSLTCCSAGHPASTRLVAVFFARDRFAKDHFPVFSIFRLWKICRNWKKELVFHFAAFFHFRKTKRSWKIGVSTNGRQVMHHAQRSRNAKAICRRVRLPAAPDPSRRDSLRLSGRHRSAANSGIPALRLCI